MTTTISVTQEDIVLGKPSDARECPVARAVARATRREVSFVDPIEGVRFIDEDWKAAYKLPEAAQKFIVAFDFAEPVSPFSFNLEV
jgi:hypothetical protein